MANGFVKLYRSFLDWEWYLDMPTKVLFLHLLLKANFMDFKWQGEQYRAGQCIVSIASLSLATGLSVQQVRTALSKLIKSRDITKHSRGKFTVITVNNWDKYQPVFCEQTTAKHSGNKRSTTDKEKKNERTFFYGARAQNYSYKGPNLELFEQMLNSDDDD